MNDVAPWKERVAMTDLGPHRLLETLPDGSRRILALEAFEVDGAAIPAGTTLELFRNGEVDRIVFPGDRDLDGIPCRGGEPVSLSRGRVWRATLARDVVIDDIACEAGSKIELTVRSGQRAIVVASLARDATIAGHRAQAHTVVEFSPEGKLVRFVPPANVLIGGIECLAGHPVVLGANGRPSQATLAEDTILRGIACRGGAPIVLAPDGRPASARLARREVLGGVAFAADTEVIGVGEGRPARGVLAEDQRIDGTPCLGGTVVTFVQGCLESFVLAEEHRLRTSAIGTALLQHLVFKRGTKVHLEQHDAPEIQVVLPEDQEVLGHSFPAGTRLSIRGMLWPQIEAMLGGEASFDGRRFEAGARIVFGRRGKIVEPSQPPPA
jgi:hypothetical protein